MSEFLNSAAQPARVLRHGHLEIDTASHRVTIAEREICLTKGEFELLELFVRNPRFVFSSRALVERMRRSAGDCSPASIRTYITRLRAKLDEPDAEESLIENVHGVGYRLRAYKDVAQQRFAHREDVAILPPQGIKV